LSGGTGRPSASMINPKWSPYRVNRRRRRKITDGA